MTDSDQRLQERYNRGDNAERLFVESIKLKYPNYKIKASNREQNMFDHIDFFVDGISYDVKSLKKVSHKDASVNSNIIWIEYRNTRGNDGWIYAKKLDRLAFELEDKFILVDRKKLKDRAESLTIKKYLGRPVAYHLHTRRFTEEQYNRIGHECRDILTYIYLSDIIDLIIEEIPKQETKRSE